MIIDEVSRSSLQTECLSDRRLSSDEELPLMMGLALHGPSASEHNQSLRSGSTANTTTGTSRQRYTAFASLQRISTS